MSKKIFIRALMVLVISYFMLVGVLYQNKVSEAGRRRDLLNPNCVQGVKNFRVRGNCRNNTIRRGFTQVNFQCYGGARGELHSRSCMSSESFREAAIESCLRMSNCRVSPTPTPGDPPPPVCEQRPACLDEDPACLIPEPEGGWCAPPPIEELTATPTPADETLTPTPCAMPTAPFCPGGQLIESNIPPEPGICPPTLLCAIGVVDPISPSPTE